jgi:hypothetical protein
MDITLTKHQAVIVLELLNKYMKYGDSYTGEITSSVAAVRIEWNADGVEIQVPDL